MRTMSGSPCLHFDCTNRNSFGYCRTTVCINENYRHEEWTRTSNRIEPVIVTPQTNADRIRQMSDEELADEYIRIYHMLGQYTDSWAWLREWLKSPADKEGK